MIVVFCTAVLTDMARVMNHKALVESIRAQEEVKPDHVYFSVSATPDLYHFLDAPRLYAGTFGSKTGGATVVTRKTSRGTVSHLRQLKYLVENKAAATDESDRAWCLFTDDDGIWREDRVRRFRDVVSRVQQDDVSAVAMVTRTHVRDADQLHRVNVSTPAQVQLLCDDGVIRIDPWTPSSQSQPDCLELGDMCVRMDVVRKYFKEHVQDDILHNMYGVEHFCDYVATLPGYRTIYLESTRWHYYWRCADKRYTNVTGAQLAHSVIPVKNVQQLMRYIQYVAEMADVPCMQETARQTLKNTLDAVTHEGERTALQYEYDKARRDKPWLPMKKKE